MENHPHPRTMETPSFLKHTFSSKLFLLYSKKRKSKQIQSSQGKLQGHIFNSVSKLYSKSNICDTDKNQVYQNFQRCITRNPSISTNYALDSLGYAKLKLMEMKSQISILTIDANNKIKSKWTHLRSNTNMSNIRNYSNKTEIGDEENLLLLSDEEFININKRIQSIDYQPSPIITLLPKILVKISLFPNTLLFYNIFCEDKISPLKAKFKVNKGENVKIYVSNTTKRPNKNNFINLYEGIENNREILIACGQKMFTKFKKKFIFLSFQSSENVEIKAIFGFGYEALFFPNNQIQSLKSKMKLNNINDNKNEIVNTLLSSNEIINKLQYYQNNPDDFFELLTKVEQINEKKRFEKFKSLKIYGNYIAKNKKVKVNLDNIIHIRILDINTFDTKLKRVQEQKVNDVKCKIIKNIVLNLKSELMKIKVIFNRRKKL